MPSSSPVFTYENGGCEDGREEDDCISKMYMVQY